MKKSRLLLLALMIFLAMSCEFLPFGTGNKAGRTFSEKVEKYPITLGGSATVTKVYSPKSCVREGKATFVAGDDSTCQVYVSFPETYTDIKGECADMGNDEAVLLKGSFNKLTQICELVSCNDSPDFYGLGNIPFFPDKTEATTVECKVEKTGAVNASIRLPALAP
jgi:hypothetical protein